MNKKFKATYTLDRYRLTLESDNIRHLMSAIDGVSFMENNEQHTVVLLWQLDKWLVLHGAAKESKVRPVHWWDIPAWINLHHAYKQVYA